MSYRFYLGENPNDEIKRIIIARLKKSYLAFSDKENDFDYSVHELRKNMKKVRAALRLVRDVTGKDYYIKKNIAARDIARTAAEIRKNDVMIETMHKMKERFNDEEASRFYPSIYQTLEIRHQDLKDKLNREGNFNAQTVLRLHELELEIENLSFEADGFDAFADGLKRVYKRGRKAKQNVMKESSAENYHEWRKRVKYLRYQLHILKNVWYRGLKGYIKELHELSDLLGNDHDLNEFKNQLQHIFHSEEYDKWLNEQEHFIENFSNEKRKEALVLGDKIYVEKPKIFVSRIRKYWEVETAGLEPT